MIKLVCLSDTHSKHKQVIVPDGDILIHAGDLTPRGNYYEFISVANWFRELKNRFQHRIMIAGNHDWGLQINRNSVIKTLFDEDLIYLQDESIELCGIKFHGSPWTPQFYNWAFMDHDEELAQYWAKIPGDTQVLITHGPPFGILDQESDNARCGSKSLLSRIASLQHLTQHIFGHIHEGYGSIKIQDVSFHNVASLNGAYKYQNPPQIIEIE